MTVQWSELAIALAIAVGVAIAVIVAAHFAARVARRRWPSVNLLARGARRPFQFLVLLLALFAVLGTARPAGLDPALANAVRGVLRILLIGVSAWLAATVLLYLEDQWLRRFRLDVQDNRVARRVHTQIKIVRRLTVAMLAVLALGGMLLTLPGVRAVGASILASAGLISVVAALAAQSTLGNVIAGVQLAFSDAVRLDDVVIVENEWGKVEEITLSYVVVRIWDDRRLVLPSTYFTTRPFQNWTRSGSELLGAVELDVDWRVDTDAMREELDRILATTDLWDGRAKVLQVTDAVGGWVRVRVLVTGPDAPTLFDLRCLVREQLVRWVREQNEAALPRQRLEVVSLPDGTNQARGDGLPLVPARTLPATA